MGTGISNGSAQHIGSVDAPDDRIAALLSEFESIEITAMSRRRADHTLDLLGRFHTCVASKMCDVTRTMSDTGSDSDPAEILRTRARLPRRESKRIVKVARQLSDMPKVREKFADGDITLDQATALAKAAEKVGPDMVEADPDLLESADRLLPDPFERHASPNSSWGWWWGWVV